LLGELIASGYLRVPLVEDPGTVSARGALVDVWPPGAREPVRMELDGETLVSMKSFDPSDQRSREALTVLALPPAREGVLDDETVARARERIRGLCDEVDWPSTKARALIEDVVQGRAFFGADRFLPALSELEPFHEQLPDDALLVLEQPSAIAEAAEEELERAKRDADTRTGEPHYAWDAFYLDIAALEGWLAVRSTLGLSATPMVGEVHASALHELARLDDDAPSLAMRDQQELAMALAAARAAGGHTAGLAPLCERISAWHDEGLRVVLTARTEAQAERLATMLQHRNVEVGVEPEADPELLLSRPRRAADAQQVIIVTGALARGTVAPTEGFVLVTEEEIFGQRAHRTRGRRTGARKARQLLDDLRSLGVGEYVVHIEHGIGRYEGLVHQNVGGQVVDLIQVAYAGGDKLYVPVYRLNQIHKLLGAEGEPKLDRLGGQTFARAKSRTRARVRLIADELLRLYAERRAAVGERTPPIDDEYRAFEATFPYEETEDQARAIEEVGVDLEAARPMDRLVCGDVGFGKTEIALRAAFRVAMSGRQVAILCPTTVLAQQHRMTFEARLAPYPLSIAMLSRFQPKAEAERIVRALRQGSIDIVVGTHRLLSKDVHFKKLGLLVVDEEQRFGVAHKERIKALKTNVDVLTLTATPIPRTLQMAISGLRDLSIMTTPPADRRAVRTIVTRHDRRVLGEALERELGRGGQVFFVYNRIGALEERANLVRELVPRARIAMVHGQMPERRLETSMLEFVEGRSDVLVTTAIIENGLDIPRANTIIVDRADLFGLAQLYQLKGRVGRARERAYCYLVLPPAGEMSDEARLRIEALSRYTELGSGFQIASLDLDLRGAGDLLGAEQSGVVATVGLEVFCHMLEEAVAELEGRPVAHDVDPELSFDVEALLPESYVPDTGVRLSIYKRLADAMDESEVAEINTEMEDRFGRPPSEARRFVHLMALKAELRRLKVLGCEASIRGVTLHLRNDTPLDAARMSQLITQQKLPYRLTPDMRLTRKTQPGEHFASGLEAVDKLLASPKSPPPPSRPGAHDFSPQSTQRAQRDFFVLSFSRAAAHPNLDNLTASAQAAEEQEKLSAPSALSAVKNSGNGRYMRTIMAPQAMPAPRAHISTV
jgi:transcription-repair coupling factor (superfamily II helicase)